MHRPAFLAISPAMPLHLTKVAVGCASVQALENRLARRAHGGVIKVPTRMRPKRMTELIGGSLHWIVKHRIVGSIEIVRFDDRSDGRIDIVCRDLFVILPARPKRAHQGWRYLEEDDAPIVGEGDDTGLAELPPALYGKLAALALL
ncbi:MAG: DUF1489 family protein [Sphingomicrobium sp.]